MSEEPEMADTYPQIHTMAQIVVTVGDEIHKFGWAPARVRKEQVATWLRAHSATGTNVKISMTLKQRAAEVQWRDGGIWYWTGEAEHGLEYAAQWVERFPAWGGSR